MPEYQVTAAVWIRGILAEHHGVPVASVRYRTGGLRSAGREEKIRLDLPPDIEIRPVGPGRTLETMLVDGEIDALYSPRTPRPYAEASSRVRRLFGDSRTAEAGYFAETGIFPIMHTLVLRRAYHHRYPWVAGSLFKAFEEARVRTLRRLDETAALRYMLPWLYAEVGDTRRIMGDDYWPYGMERNRTTLRTFLRYSYEQGLAERLLEPADLFAPETLQSFLI